jgi:predicted transcriptional regulator
MTTTLQQAFDKAAALPKQQQDAFGKFLLEELEFLAAIDEGIAAADNGDVVTVEEARQLIPKWVSESSSRSRG